MSPEDQLLYWTSRIEKCGVRYSISKKGKSLYNISNMKPRGSTGIAVQLVWQHMCVALTVKHNYFIG